MHTPLRTSSQRHRLCPRLAGNGSAATGCTISARAQPSALGRRTQVVCSCSVLLQVLAPKPGNTALPAAPYTRYSLVASVNLALARSTNIDKRLSVAANTSNGQHSSTSSGEVLNPTKLACMRPLALQKAANRASAMLSSTKSCVSWPCKKLAASAPATFITPQSLSSLKPSRGVVCATSETRDTAVMV